MTSNNCAIQCQKVKESVTTFLRAGFVISPKMLCFQCENDQNDDNLVQCDGCKRNICLQCSNLTSSEMRVMGLKGKRTLLYLCPPCREALFQVPKLIKSYDGLRAELDDMKKQLQNVSNGPAQVATAVTAAPPLTARPLPDTSAILDEILERERRANNVILVGIKECTSDAANERKSQDESYVKKILLDIDSNCDYTDKVTSVQRLGRRESGKQRPIKVVFKSRIDAVRILRNKSKANKEVRLYDDKTPMQREELNRLRETLKIRTVNGEANLTIKYVKGHPKIVNQKN